MTSREVVDPIMEELSQLTDQQKLGLLGNALLAALSRVQEGYMLGDSASVTERQHRFIQRSWARDVARAYFSAVNQIPGYEDITRIGDADGTILSVFGTLFEGTFPQLEIGRSLDQSEFYTTLQTYKDQKLDETAVELLKNRFLEYQTPTV